MEKKGLVRASPSADIPGPSIETDHGHSILQQLKKKIRLEAEVEVRMGKIIVSFYCGFSKGKPALCIVLYLNRKVLHIYLFNKPNLTVLFKTLQCQLLIQNREKYQMFKVL